MQFPLRSVFLALPLEDKPKEQYQSLQQMLDPFHHALRFQKAESPHMTLYFWREMWESLYNEITSETRRLAENTQPFSVNVIGGGTFGNRVLFLETEMTSDLRSLADRCPWPRERPFHPHITLARVKRTDLFQRKHHRILRVCNITFPIRFDRLRLYGNIENVSQTPIADFVFLEK